MESPPPSVDGHGTPRKRLPGATPGVVSVAAPRERPRPAGEAGSEKSRIVPGAIRVGAHSAEKAGDGSAPTEEAPPKRGLGTAIPSASLEGVLPEVLEALAGEPVGIGVAGEGRRVGEGEAGAAAASGRGDGVGGGQSEAGEAEDALTVIFVAVVVVDESKSSADFYNWYSIIVGIPVSRGWFSIFYREGEASISLERNAELDGSVRTYAKGNTRGAPRKKIMLEL